MNDIVRMLCHIVWSPPLIVLLVGAGIYFTIRTRCVQLRHFGSVFKILFTGRRFSEKRKNNTLSSFQAFCVSISGSVGNGNVVGVATAIALGGPGAIFWMWLIALLGSATSFVECSLAQLFKYRHDNGWKGGPFCYIEKGLGLRWLGVAFAVLLILSYGLIQSMTQSNSMAVAISNTFSVPPPVTGICIVCLLFLIVIGGAKRIAQVASVISPFMAVSYICAALIIVGLHWKEIPGTISLIFSCAFGLDSALGGMVGSAVVLGVKRGIFSNEAGQGSAPVAAAGADVEFPVQQGIVQSFGVLFDTLIVCTATALVILTTGQYNVFNADGVAVVENASELGNNYVSFTQSAVDTVFTGFGNIFITITLGFFAFTTLMAACFYSESGIVYILGKGHSVRKVKIWTWIYTILFFVFVFVGAVKSTDTVWMIGDIFLGLTTWINVIALLILCPKVIRALKEYEER